MSTKARFGEVVTPPTVVSLIVDYVNDSDDVFTKCIEAGSGDGRIAAALGKSRSCKGASFHLTEIQERFHSRLGELGTVSSDFLERTGEYDLVFGNPPYNFGGAIWVPSSRTKRRESSGKAVWRYFVCHGLGLLVDGGVLVVLVPAIWMKPDKARLYELLSSYRIEKIHSFDADETRRLFKGTAQTPLVLVRIRKAPPLPTFSIYNSFSERHELYTHTPGLPIPMCGASIIGRIRDRLGPENVGLEVVKCSNPPRTTSVTPVYSNDHIYPCVVATHLGSEIPYLLVRYTDRPTPYLGDHKLILGHLMHGIPFHDRVGKYGIGKRDIIVVMGENDELEEVARFLRTRLVQYLFGATRYRMRFLEKYAFSFLPKAGTLPVWEAEEDLYEFFGLSESERKEILANVTSRLSPEIQARCSAPADGL